MLFYLRQQKLCHKCKYPQYRIQMGISSFSVCSVARWPTYRHTRTPNAFAVATKEGKVNFA